MENLKKKVCSVLTELRKAGNGERNGQTHDPRRAAGQQVGRTALHHVLFFRVLLLPPLLMSSDGLVFSLQVSGHVRGQDGADSPCQHRIQRQL